MTKHDLTYDQKAAPLLEHLHELKRRLIYSLLALLVAFCVCYAYAQDIYYFLAQPLAALYEGESGRRLIYTGLTEAFFTYLRVAFYAALFIAFPFIACQFYLFLSPGLYKKERRVLLPFLIATPLLFFAGGALVYYYIFPLAWQFFINFETVGGGDTLPIQLEARVS